MMTTHVLRSLSILATLTGAAFAADVQTILQHAKSIETDATQISTTLKSKKFDASGLKTQLDGAHSNFANLQKAVSQYEAANPGTANSTEWKAVKDRVELLGIFLDRKNELASDSQKNRGMLRAHAQGIAKRAADLQQTISRLQSTSTASSGD